MPRQKLYHTYTDDALKRLAAAANGDRHARQALQNRETVHRMATQRLSPADYLCFLGDDVWLDFQKDAGRVRMSVRLELATFDGMKRHWPEIRAWQNFLRAWQGPWRAGGKGGLLYRLEIQRRKIRHRNGFSYARLATQLNDAAVEDLRQYVVERNPRLKSIGLQRAHALFRMMGLSESESQYWCETIVDRLQRRVRNVLSPNEGPISREHVRRRLDTWRTQSRDWLVTHPLPSST